MDTSQSAISGPRSILVVEDEVVTRTITARYFERAGLHVFAAETGAEALAILRTYGKAIDWLFTDICLPGEISGWIVGAEFNLNHPLRPVIYATASAPRAPAQAAGSVFIRKPYSPLEVYRVFETLASHADTLSTLLANAAEPQPAERLGDGDRRRQGRPVRRGRPGPLLARHGRGD